MDIKHYSTMIKILRLYGIWEQRFKWHGLPLDRFDECHTFGCLVVTRLTSIAKQKCSVLSEGKLPFSSYVKFKFPLGWPQSKRFFQSKETQTAGSFADWLALSIRGPHAPSSHPTPILPYRPLLSLHSFSSFSLMTHYQDSMHWSV